MKEREWMLGDAIVNELYEYKHLGVLKIHVNSFGFPWTLAEFSSIEVCREGCGTASPKLKNFTVQ